MFDETHPETGTWKSSDHFGYCWVIPKNLDYNFSPLWPRKMLAGIHDGVLSEGVGGMIIVCVSSLI